MAKKRGISPKDWAIEEKLKYYQAWSIEHEIVFTTSSLMLKRTDGKTKPIFSGTKIPAKDLNFIKEVKKEIISKQSVFDNKRNQINYFRAYKLSEGCYRKCFEVDLNKAYWKIAFKMGYISRETYLKGLKVGKMTRLVAVGAAASVKHSYLYDIDKRDYVYTGEEKDDFGRSAFFHISFEVSCIMAEIARKLKTILFYWFDAFFVRSQDDALLIRDELRSFDLDCSIDLCSSVFCKDYKTHRKVLVTIPENEGNGFDYTNLKEPKQFTLPGLGKKDARGYVWRDFSDIF